MLTLLLLLLLLALYVVVLPCRNPLAALELHIPAATLPPTMLDSAHRDREFEEEEEEHNQVSVCSSKPAMMLLAHVGC